MSNPEKGQLYIEDWEKKQEEEKKEEKPPVSEPRERDCRCGGSGPCNQCERGIALAASQGHPYRRSSRRRR